MSPRERTPEEREAARRDRERRRLERAGEPIPDHLLEPHERPAPPEPPAFAAPPPAAPEPPAYEPEPPAPAPEPTPPAHEPPPAHDVPPPAFDAPPPAHDAPAPGAQPPEQDPQATVQWDVSQAWADEQHPSVERGAEPPEASAAGRPASDPDATRPHAVDPDATQVHEVGSGWTDDVPAAQPAPPAAPPAGADEPIGTRRVRRDELANIHRPERGAGGRGRRGLRSRDDALPRRGRGVRVKRPGESFAGGARRRRSAGPRIAAGVVVLLALVVVWFLVSLFQPFGGGDGGDPVRVEIPNGASAGEIGDILADRGVVSSSFFFGLRAQLSGERANLRSGTFRLREGMGYGPALDALTEVPVTRAAPTVKVSIPEGRSRREVASIAREAGLRGSYVAVSRRSSALDPSRYGAPRGASLEGFLFPATYDVRRGASARALVEQQLRAFQDNLASVNLSFARSRNLDVYDVLIIASMVEREVSVPSERPLVAAVIYNRLRDGIPLGIDATLRFEQDDWVNPLRQSVLEADTPYNTRTKQGLPPGPIGNPGLASIRAAANPARSEALYYVVKPGTCGEHVFANSYDEHLANVQRYDDARAAAGGRSPTRC